VNRTQTCLALCCLSVLAWSCANAQTIDAAAHRSIAAALQAHIKAHPSVFPLESYDGGVQSFVDGLRYPYFGYGERRYSYRTDFHPAFDVAYLPLETGDIKTLQGDIVKVRAPQTYLKHVYAIQAGTLYSVTLVASGFKIVLKHPLEDPYFDAEGKPYTHYFTSYRHLDARSILYLSLLARKVTGDVEATYKDLIGKYEFDAGEVIAAVGFSPEKTKTPPRTHLDFSLNLVSKPNTGQYIRDYSMNPLLLFPPFEYADPYSHSVTEGGMPAYQFVIGAEGVAAPTSKKDGHFGIEIHAGFVSAEGVFEPRRYFALNAMQVAVFNDGEQIGSYTIDRHQKLGYDTSSNDRLDNADTRVPHFVAPLDEQGDVYRMGGVIPARWLRKLDYDWSKPGKIEVRISSIWDGYLEGHSASIEIPL
jgi:hypothetical protein